MAAVRQLAPPVAMQVVNLTTIPFSQRELMLVKVRCKASQRGEVRDLADIFHGTIADVGPNTITVEIQGKDAKMVSLQQLLQPYGEASKAVCLLCILTLTPAPMYAILPQQLRCCTAAGALQVGLQIPSIAPPVFTPLASPFRPADTVPALSVLSSLSPPPPRLCLRWLPFSQS